MSSMTDIEWRTWRYFIDTLSSEQLRDHLEHVTRELAAAKQAYETEKAAAKEVSRELAALREQMRWIPVGERLPDVGKWCEIITPTYGFDGDTILSNGRWVENVHVLYWRYSDAPTPPEGE